MAKEKKYIIELTETQLRLIADCVEDCHRFAAGQTELHNTVAYSTMWNHNYSELTDELRKLQPLVTPLLGRGVCYKDETNPCHVGAYQLALKECFKLKES